MKGIEFPQMNFVFGAPKGEEDRVYALPVFNDGISSTAVFEISDEELEEMSKTKRIVLNVASGVSFAPVWLGTTAPLIDLHPDVKKMPKWGWWLEDTFSYPPYVKSVAGWVAPVIKHNAEPHKVAVEAVGEDGKKGAFLWPYAWLFPADIDQYNHYARVNGLELHSRLWRPDKSLLTPPKIIT